MSENLTPKRRKAIESLLTTGDIAAAARAAGVSRQTLYTWLREADFRAALQSAETAALESLSRALVRLGDKATATLDSAMSDDLAALPVKIRAADIVLSRLLQLRELVDLEARVTELERLKT